MKILKANPFLRQVFIDALDGQKGISCQHYPLVNFENSRNALQDPKPKPIEKCSLIDDAMMLSKLGENP